MHDWNSYVTDPAYRHRRVFSITVDGELFWIKRAAKDYKNRAQAWINAKKNHLHDEVRAIQALARRGMLVPQLMQETGDYIVLSDIGESVQQCMQREAEMRTTLLTQVAKKLSELHRAQGWHGNAMLRNFTWHNGQIGMIDFEDTAHASWPLSMRQAYDIWQVLYSAARVENGEALVRHFLAQYEPSSRALGLLRGVAWLQSPLYLLLWPIQSRLKRDIRQGVIAIGALLTHRT